MSFITGKKLKYFKKKANLNIKKMSKLIGVSNSTMSRMLKDGTENKMVVEKVKRLTKFYKFR